jgi:hypothetical protein
MFEPTNPAVTGLTFGGAASDSRRVRGMLEARAIDQVARDARGGEAQKQPAFSVQISDDARRLLQDDDIELEEGEAPPPAADGDEGEAEPADAAGPRNLRGEPMSREQLVDIQRLTVRDREVRSHEAAHVAAARGLAGAVSFEYERGPDGQQYAVGGHVPIDTAEGRTPEETLRKARTIRAASLSPADPSAADRAVAAKAVRMATQAAAEISQARIEGISSAGQPSQAPPPEAQPAEQPQRGDGGVFAGQMRRAAEAYASVAGFSG